MKVIGKVPPVLLYCLIALSTLSETIYSAALPEITESLHTEGGVAQFSTAVYYFGFALGIFTLGRVSDIFGRRPVVLFGITIYAISVFLLSFTTRIETFIILRFCQAYGASVGSVIGQAMARDSYQGWELSYMYASVAMIMAVVPSVGSSVGGYIIEYFNWPMIFRFLAVLSLFLLSLYVIFLPETNPYTGEARSHRFLSVVRVAITDKVLLSYAFIVGAFNGICFGFYIQAPFIFIENLKMHPSTYGKLFLILSVANLLGSLSSRYFIKKFISTFKIKVTGLAFSVIGCLWLFINAFSISPDTSVLGVTAMIFLPIMIHQVGHSLLIPMLLRHALEDYYKVTGTAGSIFGSFYYLITAFVSFLISFFHSDTINNFAYLFITLEIFVVVLFYMTIRWKIPGTKYEFG